MIDATPRYRRVTYRNPEGGRSSFVGMWRERTDGVLEGKSKTDVKDGVSLNLCLVTRKDLVKIERENPKYETWEADD